MGLRATPGHKGGAAVGLGRNARAVEGEQLGRRVGREGASAQRRRREALADSVLRLLVYQDNEGNGHL